MLEIRGLSRTFGLFVAIDNVETLVKGNECLGVMGPNGAGKSTLFDLLSGTIPPSRGRIFLDGRDITAMPVEARVKIGIGRAFQIPKPFHSMSVKDHIRLSALAGNGLRGRMLSNSVDEVLELTGLADKADLKGGALRLLDRKRLELAKALATGPKVLLLDEISGGLTAPEIQTLIALITKLKKPNLAILWIEHIAHALAQVCDKIMMLNLGVKVTEDVPDKVASNEQVRRLYLGALKYD